MKSWNTNPRWSRRKAAISFSLMVTMFFPSRSTCPLVGLSRIVLADEPTGALDSKATDSLLNLFDQINGGSRMLS